MKIFRLCIFTFISLFFSWANAAIQVTDDVGHLITLQKPATRIISLSPHLTELLFDIGAGQNIVGVSAYSDYPEAAKHLPLVGNSNRLDVEKMAKLHPDLILAWEGGNNPRDLQVLNSLHYPVYFERPSTLAAIPTFLLTLGKLTGHQNTAQKTADQFNQTYNQLKTAAAKHPKHFRIFFQLWGSPLMTIGRDHYINEALALCGGENIFNNKIGVLNVDREAVIARNPEVIITDDSNADVEKTWAQWPNIAAVAKHQFVVLPASELLRYTPRILLAVSKICKTVQ